MMNELKHQVLDAIEKHVDVFKPVPPIRYRIRCPICGDSQTNPKDAHCYIKCSNDPSEPLVYICFKCNAHGRVNRYFLSRLGIEDDLINQIDRQNYFVLPRIRDNPIEVMTGTPDPSSPQAKYLTHRLGPSFTTEDLDRFKIIWDMNLIRPYISSRRILNTLPSNQNSISFLSDQRSMLLSRTFLESAESQWRKIKLFPDEQKAFYTIKVTLDLFTKEPIIVHIAEGVFDILSVYKNFSTPNSVYVATLGSNYLSAVDYMIAKGFVGSNVEVRIYMDQGIDERELRRQLRSYRWLFSNITIYWNLLSKDIGVPIKQIQLASHKV